MNDYLPSTTSGVKGTAFKKGMVHVLLIKIKMVQALPKWNQKYTF